MSNNNMDDLLAQLNEEFEPARQSRVQRQPRKSTSPPPSSSAKPSIHQMLAQLKEELESGRGRPNSTPSPEVNSPKQERAAKSVQDRDRLNALIDTDYRRQAHKREQKFAEIRRKEEAKIAEHKRRQQELIEAQQREELREKRRKEALKETAKEWLKNLNPRSEEGRWFEEFSYSYDDKLKAAIDYLEAMRESGL